MTLWNFFLKNQLIACHQHLCLENKKIKTKNLYYNIANSNPTAYTEILNIVIDQRLEDYPHITPTPFPGFEFMYWPEEIGSEDSILANFFGSSQKNSMIVSFEISAETLASIIALLEKPKASP